MTMVHPWMSRSVAGISTRSLRTLILMTVLAACVHVPLVLAQPPALAQQRVRPPLELDEDGTDAYGSVLTAVVPLLPSSSVPVCVALWGGPPSYWYTPSDVLLERIQRIERRLIPHAQCPATYDLMYAMVDSAGRDIAPKRPAGYEDPFQLAVRDSLVRGGDSATVAITASQGTFNYHYSCTTRRAAGKHWEARCRFLGRSISTVPSPPEALHSTHGLES
jgi:hypothetical protein